MPGADQAAGLDAEAVQPGDAVGVQRADDELDAGGGLVAAYRSDNPVSSPVSSLPRFN